MDSRVRFALTLGTAVACLAIAATVVRGKKVFMVKAEGVRAVAGEFQLLERGDFRILAGDTAEAAPERGVIAAGPGPVGQEIFAAV